MHPRLGSTTATAGFPWGKQPGFPMEEIPMGQYSCKKKNIRKCKHQTVTVNTQTTGLCDFD